MMITGFFSLLFWLIFGHFLADYAQQSDFIAKGKCRCNSPLYGVPWYYILAAHATIHGGVVGIITGSTPLAVLETVLHFIIDYLKCDKRINIHVDFALHVSCKVAYALFLSSF